MRIESLKKMTEEIASKKRILSSIVTKFCTIHNKAVDDFIVEKYNGSEPKNFRSEWFKKDFPCKNDEVFEYTDFYIEDENLIYNWCEYDDCDGLEEKHGSIPLETYFKGEEAIKESITVALNERHNEINKNVNKLTDDDLKVMKLRLKYNQNAKDLTDDEVNAYLKVKKLIDEKGEF